ncbi:MAG: hypothetical protein JNL96_20710 [Planctomycetaceae bacterium]|nr:hypothetical protein [Planctomycetaceae bacterium]
MYVTVTIDTEEEWDWNAGWPTGEPLSTNVAALPRFQSLADDFGIAATYFVNYAVMADERACETMHQVAQHDRVEWGMHIHPWNTPPFTEERLVRPKESFLHNHPDEVINAKLTTVYESFRKQGLRPTSFRGGRYSSGGPIHTFLRDHGFLADASVLPLTTWPEEGAPNYRDRDLKPVRLAPRFEGDGPFWEIPLSLGFSRSPFRFYRSCYERIERSWLAKLRLIGISERLGLVRRIWLNFESDHCERYRDLLAALREQGVPHLCFTVHSSSLRAGPGPYTRSAADEERIFARIEDAFRWISQSGDFRPVTVSQLAVHLETEYYARHRN